MEITEKAIDEIVEFINKKINIPFVPESVEALIIKAVLLAVFHILSEKSMEALLQKQ